MGCSSSTAVVKVPPPPTDFFDKYELGDVLGKGAYGTVRRAHSIESDEVLAVKILDLRGDRCRSDFSAEQRAWAQVGVHPNVVGFRDSFTDRSFAYFVMEFCPGSLYQAWREEQQLDEYTYARYFREMTQALVHIHSVGVVHRDVKQDNFLLGGRDGRTVKLTDFGLSAVWVERSRGLEGEYGTAPYMAPEMVSNSDRHGPPADVWSLGVIVYMAFFGGWPYGPTSNTKIEMKRAIRKGNVKPKFAPASRFVRNVVSDVGIRFVTALLDRNPTTRPSAAMCLELEYLNEEHHTRPEANLRNARNISLELMLEVARKYGAFRLTRPDADDDQEVELMNLQSAAQFRHRSSLVSPEDVNRSTSSTSDSSAKNVTPPHPEEFTIHVPELSEPTE